MTSTETASTTGPEVDAPPPAAAETQPHRRRWRPRQGASMLAAATVVSAVIVGLLLLVAFISVREDSTEIGPTSEVTLDHYDSLADSTTAITAMKNTGVFTFWTVVWALVFGLTIAWLVERTDLGGRSIIYTLMTIGVLIPGFFTAMGWVFLAHPRIGVLNHFGGDVLGRETPIFNVLTLTGMGWVQGLSLTAVVFVLTAASLSSMDSSLEETAAMSGARFFTVMRRITLPLAWPGLLGAVIFTVTIAIATFDVPLIIGLSNRIVVFSTYLYNRTTPSEGPPEYGVSAAFSMIMVVVGLALGWLYTRMLRRSRNYQVVSGKNYQPRKVQLGKWRWPAVGFVAAYFLFAIGLPLLTMVWTALLPFLQRPSAEAFDTVSLENFRNLNLPLLRTGIRNTATLMILAPTITVAIAIAFSWTVLRTKYRFRFVYDYVAFLPQAVPNIIFAFAAFLIVINLTSPLDLYGSVTIIVVVMVLVSVSFATRMVNGSLIQISDELEEAARTSGARTGTVMRRVTVPLIRPALLTAWLWLAVLGFRELTIPTVLFAGENLTVSVVVLNLWQQGENGQAAAVTLMMLTVMAPLILLYWWATGRAGRGRAAVGLTEER